MAGVVLMECVFENIFELSAFDRVPCLWASFVYKIGFDRSSQASLAIQSIVASRSKKDFETVLRDLSIAVGSALRVASSTS